MSTYRFLGPEGFGVYSFDGGEPRRVDGAADHLLIPGFVDVHIHGAFGIDVMSASSDRLRELCRKLEDAGYEGFLPTTVTASPEDVAKVLANLPDDPMVLGFHLEGPFISRKYPGAQPQSAIADVPSGASAWDPILDDPRLKLITLAPELPGAEALIRRLAARGVTVSMGHTDATYAQCAAGFEAGARHTTHTYNAMRPLHHREAGTVGYAFLNDEVWTELIYDRHHVTREAASILMRCKPEDRLLAVSDGTMAAGLPAGQIVVMWGLECVVGQGQVRLKDGTLAGSGITLLDAFRNLHDDFGPETAIRATSLNPRASLGLTAEPKTWLVLDRELRIVERRALGLMELIL